MNTMARFAYRLLLHLHPAQFQHEFGTEMLWIFDKEQQAGNAAYLLVDGAVSLMRQRCRRQKVQRQLSIASGTIISNPGIGMVRLLQGSLLYLFILLSLIQLSEHAHLFVPAVKWSNQMSSYTITLQTRSHSEIVFHSLP
jgi:hypothetical protein